MSEIISYDDLGMETPLEELARFHPKGPFPLFVKDLMQDTVGWLDQDRWKYLLLLAHLFSQGGFIPDDDGYLCEVMGLWKARGYRKTLDRIRSKFSAFQFSIPIAMPIANPIANADQSALQSESRRDWLTQKRVLIEVEKAFRRSEISRKGGRAKAAKNPAVSITDGRISAVPPTPSPSQEAAAASGKADEPVITIIQAFDQERAKAFGDDQRRPYPNSTDRMTAQRWIDAGATLPICQAIFSSIMARLASAGKQPPATLKYFDSPVAEGLQEGKRAGIANAPATGFGSGDPETDFDPDEVRARVAQQQHGEER